MTTSTSAATFSGRIRMHIRGNSSRLSSPSTDNRMRQACLRKRQMDPTSALNYGPTSSKVMQERRSVHQYKHNIWCSIYNGINDGSSAFPVHSLRATCRTHNLISPLKENRNLVSRALYLAVCPPRRGKLSVKTAGKASGKQLFHY